MQLTRVVVQVENDWCSEARVRMAAGLAAQHGAELVGVVSDQTPREALAGVPVSRGVEAAVALELQHHRTDAAQRFQRAAGPLLQAHRLHEVRGPLSAGLLDAALVADLLVIGQDPDPQDVGEAITTQIVLAAPCPTLVVPRDDVGTFNPRRILVGWKASLPTSRALRGALPLLLRADAVLLVHVGESTDARHGTPGVCDAAAWLQRQGVELATIELPADPDDPGHGLLDEADRFGADLIVAGAYARSPLRERLLGGATATLLSESELPLLLAH